MDFYYNPLDYVSTREELGKWLMERFRNKPKNVNEDCSDSDLVDDILLNRNAEND